MEMNFTKEQLLAKPSEFLNDFDDINDVVRDFDITLDELKDKVILFADYTYIEYSGDAYVLGYDQLRDMFFEVHGSHCSCYGLEGQWDVEYYTFEQLVELLSRRCFKNSRYRSTMSSDEFLVWLES